MAVILHLETATKVCSVALSRDGELISLQEINDEQYSHGENLTILIQKALEEVDLKMSDLSAVSIASGPGSYTGLRIGASTAKGICYALNIPLIAIDALTSLAYLAREKYEGMNICAVIDARRMEVYNLITDQDLNPLKEISADIIEQDTYDEFVPFVCIGDGALKLAELWEGRGCVIDLTVLSSAVGQIKFAHQKYEAQDFENVAYWEPFYLKDFIAGKKKVQ